MEEPRPTVNTRDFSPPPKHSRWESIKKQLLRKPPKKRLIIISGIGAILVVVGLFLLFWQRSIKPEPVVMPDIVIPEQPEEPVDTRMQSPLTGVLIEPDIAEKRVTAVMIENSIDARPQSGLEEAGVVFEAIAEGGITRFMALYLEQNPKNIGPIRSARPYYVEWAKGFDAAFVHSGGSPAALQLIRSLGVNDLDHGRYGNELAQRVSYRFAPHNVYTSMSTIDKVAESAGFTDSDFTPFTRIDERELEDDEAEASSDEQSAESSSTTPAEETDTTKKATSITFDISSANYNTSYTYDAKTKLYKRTMAQRAHTDKESNKQISPRVVVALESTHSTHPNGIHSVYKTVGSGKVTVFQNGEVLQGTWRKSSQSASLEFIGSDGESMALAPGQTWITIIPAGRLSYK